MLKCVSGVISLVLVLALVLPARSAAVQGKRAPTKHRVTRHWHGYGFLPGYRPARSRRTRAGRALLSSIWAAVLWARVVGFLSRSLKWRRVWPLLDADAYWSDVELWEIRGRLTICRNGFIASNTLLQFCLVSCAIPYGAIDVVRDVDGQMSSRRRSAR